MRKHIFIFFTSFFFFLGISAQEKYRAVHWTLEDGLSQAVTAGMIKDVNGFLWITTEHGLNRFDGNTFKNYFHDPKNKETIPSDKVYGLVEDSLHNIWIGTNKGLSRYDIKADKFSNFSSKVAENNLIPFWTTKDEVFYWDYPAQLSAINIKSFVKRTLVKLEPTDTVGYATSDIHAIFEEASNSIWLEKGIPGWVGGKGGGLLQISLTNGKREDYRWPCYKGIPNDGHFTEGMKYDRHRNSIWISSTDGLIEFSLKDKKFRHIDELNEWIKLKDFGQWAGIDIDPSGRIWMGTHPAGTFIYNPVDHTVNIPFPNDSVQQKNVSDDNVFIYCDKEGIIWSGFWSRKGIYQLLPFKPVVKHYTPSPKKDSLNSSIVVDAKDGGNGKIWLSTPNGINILDTKTGTFKALQQKDLPGIKMIDGFIGVISIDTLAQKAWLVTGIGVFKMDMLTQKCMPITFKNLKNEITPARGIPKSDGGEIFFTAGDDKNQSVFVLNLNSDTAYQILSFPGSLFNVFYTVPVENHFLFLYGNTNEKNNQTYENKNGKWLLTHTPIDSIEWTSIAYIKEDNTYWVAGSNQLFHFDKNFRIIQTYSKDNGLRELPVVGLINDNNGNIWFHTDRSIQELNVTTGQITTMSEKDGSEKQDFELLSFANKDKGGNIYYGGGIYGIGLTKISPGNFVSTTSSVYLKSLTINQNPFALKESINNTDTLLLKYNQTRIAIDAGIIDFYSRGKSLIRYKLESNSLNEGWQYAPYYYTIRYEGLKPGSYRLLIQASNASNEFNGPEKLLVIHISPPFWQTWWFRIVAAILIIASIYSLIQYRSRNLRKRNIALEEKVLQRTNELKYSLENLRETQTQLIQREKMASLGELTAGIAHEIQNPLNFVNNFSDINKELIAEMKEEIEKGNYDEVRIVAKIVEDNQEKISHHGKRAGAIVKGMLEHSRSSTGVKEPTDINALADEYFRLAYHGLRAKDKSFNATMKTDFDENIGKINIIPHDIGRVILNLITNAFYAVTEKSKQQVGDNYEPTVTVSTKKINSKVEIKVKDNGNGIPQEILDKIFQPFFTTKPTGEGTGLGLSLSYDIITKAHNGELRAETKEGEYAEFIIRLPSEGNSQR